MSEPEAASPPTRTGRRRGGLLLEFSMIIIGALLALALDGWEGTRPILLTHSAFDLAVMTGVLARLPADTSLSLAKAYEVAERGQERRGNLALATLQSDFRDGPRYLRLQELGVTVELQIVKELVPLLERAEALVTTVPE